MARLQLSERELQVLSTCLASAIEGTCIPDWEFESLIGCSRGRAKRSLEAGMRRIARGERPAEITLERMVVLLSALLGASQDEATNELDRLVARLGMPERSPLQSGIALRRDVVLPARAQRG